MCVCVCMYVYIYIYIYTHLQMSQMQQHDYWRNVSAYWQALYTTVKKNPTIMLLCKNSFVFFLDREKEITAKSFLIVFCIPNLFINYMPLSYFYKYVIGCKFCLLVEDTEK